MFLIIKQKITGKTVRRIKPTITALFAATLLSACVTPIVITEVSNEAATLKPLNNSTIYVNPEVTSLHSNTTRAASAAVIANEKNYLTQSLKEVLRSQAGFTVVNDNNSASYKASIHYGLSELTDDNDDGVNRQITVTINENGSAYNSSSAGKVFTGNALSYGVCSDIRFVANQMLGSMFNDWPNVAGVRTVTQRADSDVECNSDD